MSDNVIGALPSLLLDVLSIAVTKESKSKWPHDMLFPHGSVLGRYSRHLVNRLPFQLPLSEARLGHQCPTALGPGFMRRGVQQETLNSYLW